MTNEFTKIYFYVFMNHEKKIQSSEEKKTQIDRLIRSLSEKKKKRKKNLVVSTVHTFSPMLSALPACRSPASSVFTHSHFPVEVSQSNFLRVVFVYLTH